MAVAILTMAIGTFAIGLTEFAVMGLLPRIAADLAVSVGVGIAVLAAWRGRSAEPAGVRRSGR